MEEVVCIKMADDGYKQGWHERNGGNLSYRLKKGEVDAIRGRMYRDTQWQPIGTEVPGLAGGVQKKTEENKNALTVSGAVHSADIEYAMGNLPTNRVYDWQPEDFTVSEIFQGYYLNFVKTGNPNGLGLPEWTPTNGQQTPTVMQIDVNSYLMADPQLENIYTTVDAVVSGK